MTFILSAGDVDTTKTIRNIIQQAGRHQHDDEYGVYLDEFTDLIGEEDVFDTSHFTEPTPLFEHFLPRHIPVATIPLDPDRNENLKVGDRVRAAKRKIHNRDVDRPDDDLKVEPVEQKKKNKEELDIGTAPDYDPLTHAADDGTGTFTINQAAFNLFRPGYTIIAYGPRRSGKSIFIEHVMMHMRHYFSDVIVCTLTKDSGEYFQHIPYANVLVGFDGDLIAKVLEYQAAKKRAQTRGEDTGNYNLLIVVDDCMAQGLRYETVLNRLFYNGRHSNVTVIVAVQDVRGIAPSATINADVVATFSLPDRRGRETMREKFADYLTRDEFNRLMDHPLVNQKFQIILFDVSHRYNDLNHRIMVGTIDKDSLEPFVMGDKKMWNTPEARQQLIELGMGHLLDMEDWGIVKPRYVDPRVSRYYGNKNANSKK